MSALKVVSDSKYVPTENCISVTVKCSTTVIESIMVSPSALNSFIKSYMAHAEVTDILTVKDSFWRLYKLVDGQWHTGSGGSLNEAYDNLFSYNPAWQDIPFLHQLGMPPTGNFLRTMLVLA